jgi:hypothetical protein
MTERNNMPDKSAATSKAICVRAEHACRFP